MNFIFFGPPGAGKGTQAKILSKKLNIPHLSTGEILRKISVEQDKIANELKKIMEEGLLVSDELITSIVEKRIYMKDCEKGFIFDGFPRTIVQTKNLEKILNKISKKIDYVIQINIPENILLKRITGRLVCKNCLEVYNKFFDPIPLNGCRICGKNETILRDDDDEKSLVIRLQKYNQETKPLLKYYEDQKVLNHINGDDTSEIISKSIFDIISNFK